MILLIDIGNSRIKWAIYQNNIVQPLQASSLETPVQAYISLAKSLTKAPAAIYISSVRSPEEDFSIIEFLKFTWNIDPVIVQAEAQYHGLINAYKDPKTLGSDRWCALLAAQQLEKNPCLIIDAGTRVTIDALHKGGKHLGGMILPGLQLSKNAVVQSIKTSFVSEKSEKSYLATNTVDAIEFGIHFSLITTISNLIEDFKNTIGENPKIFLTGGDAPILAENLDAECVLKPDLGLIGLSIIAKKTKQASLKTERDVKQAEESFV